MPLLLTVMVGMGQGRRTLRLPLSGKSRRWRGGLLGKKGATPCKVRKQTVGRHCSGWVSGIGTNPPGDLLNSCHCPGSSREPHVLQYRVFKPEQTAAAE